VFNLAKKEVTMQEINTATGTLTLEQYGDSVFVVQWEDFYPIMQVAVHGMPQRYPLRLTVNGHNLIDNQKVAIFGCKGIESVCSYEPQHLSLRKYHQIKVIDANTIEFPHLGVDERSYYRGGGFIQHTNYISLAGVTGIFDIYEETGAPVWLSIPAVLDDTLKTITVTVTQAQRNAFLAQFTTLDAYCKLTMINSFGEPFTLMVGKLTTV